MWKGVNQEKWLKLLKKDIYHKLQSNFSENLYRLFEYQFTYSKVFLNL